MNLPENFYHCDACCRTYRSTSTPENCLVCGARRSGAKAAPRPKAACVTDSFLLAVERAKGNFRE